MSERYLGMAKLKNEADPTSFDDGPMIKARRSKGRGKMMRAGDAMVGLRWYVVRDAECSYDIDDDEACVWTLSKSPKETGWSTDSGYSGYGLTYPEARELADAANDVS